MSEFICIWNDINRDTLFKDLHSSTTIGYQSKQNPQEATNKDKIILLPKYYLRNNYKDLLLLSVHFKRYAVSNI